jgi:hypothetical protein
MDIAIGAEDCADAPENEAIGLGAALSVTDDMALIGCAGEAR